MIKLHPLTCWLTHSLSDERLLLIYLLTSLLGLLLSGCFAICPSSCNQQGTCNKYGTLIYSFTHPLTHSSTHPLIHSPTHLLGRCKCADGFQGADCSERTCPTGAAWSDQASTTDTAHALAECSNRGTCTRNSGVCVCMDGFTGSACERMTCYRYILTSSLVFDCTHPRSR